MVECTWTNPLCVAECANSPPQIRRGASLVPSTCLAYAFTIFNIVDTMLWYDTILEPTLL